MHGAYWALANQDEDKVGVTLHHVDAGIDTGMIISQEKINLVKGDCFVTYPLLQLRKGIDILEQFIRTSGQRGQVLSEGVRGPLYYHPRATQYLSLLLRRGLK